MKKAFGILACLMIVLSISVAHADLIGVDLTGRYPNIFFDNGGSIVYDYNPSTGHGTFTLVNVYDLKLTEEAGGSVTDLKSTSIITMEINLVLTASGELVSGTMAETLKSGWITIGGYTYESTSSTTDDIVLLSGTVEDFGFFDEGQVSRFDMIVGSLEGALVSSGYWPDEYDTGVVIRPDPSSWDGAFDHDFVIATAKGNKAPLPEPTTVVLLGLGLAGVGAMGRMRRRS